MPSAEFDSLNARAPAFAEAGSLEAAHAAWRQALAIEPDAVGVMLELSYVDSLSGRYRAAREWVLRAARSPLRSDEDTTALLRRLRTFNEAAVLHGIVDRLLADSQ